MTQDRDHLGEEYRKSMKGRILTSVIVLMQSIVKRLEEADALFRDGVLCGLLKPHIAVVLAAPTPYDHESLSPELTHSLERLWREDIISSRGYEMVEDERLVIEHAAKQ